MANQQSTNEDKNNSVFTEMSIILLLIGSAVSGFNHARTLTKASAKGLDARQDYYNKGICSPGSLVNNPVR